MLVTHRGREIFGRRRNLPFDPVAGDARPRRDLVGQRQRRERTAPCHQIGWREAGDREALKRIQADSGEGRTFTREDLAEAWGISE